MPRLEPLPYRRGLPRIALFLRAKSTDSALDTAAGFVDAQVAPFAHRIRPSAVDRLVEEAIVRYMPDEARRRRDAAADGRHAHVHTHQVSFEGTVWVQAEVDLADALDLDTALSAGAARLADLGSTASVDVRRSEALGEMARRRLALDLPACEQGVSMWVGWPRGGALPAGSVKRRRGGAGTCATTPDAAADTATQATAGSDPSAPGGSQTLEPPPTPDPPQTSNCPPRDAP